MPVDSSRPAAKSPRSLSGLVPAGVSGAGSGAVAPWVMPLSCSDALAWLGAQPPAGAATAAAAALMREAQEGLDTLRGRLARVRRSAGPDFLDQGR
jgi:hypothetical protein